MPKGHKTVSVLICSLQQNVFGQFTKHGRFFKSPQCKIGAPREFLLIYPKILGRPPGVLPRGVPFTFIYMLRRYSYQSSATALKPSSSTDYNIPIISPPAKHPKHCFDFFLGGITIVFEPIFSSSITLCVWLYLTFNFINIRDVKLTLVTCNGVTA